MSELTEYRKEIDRIDRELTRLVEHRFNVVRKVAEYKAQNDLPILDSSREEAVIQRNLDRLENSEYAAEIAEFYQNLMTISKAIQKKSGQENFFPR